MEVPPSATRHCELVAGRSGDAAAFGVWITWIRQRLTDWRLAAVDTDAVLVAAELLSNAARHAGGVLRLTLDHRGDALRIAVCDPSPEPPRPRRHRPESVGGHGMFIIDSLTLRWGTLPGRDGKTVWADLPVPPR
ncbi:ATP-binding protein [Streptomyces sp. NBC_00158]|uniref:ATP-binding protein n=1 Tax=Streptomyces sp. NBC_00158 TaxID=2903627 RepID=UPI00324B4874